jgi:multiple sugar transport system ATP-binding protein
MAEVQIRDVRKAYDSVEVIHGMDFTIPDGEFVVLVGPSGCGKSTLLRMIAGLEGITSGQIAIGDRVVNGVPPSERDIAMVFQNYALYPHKTVRSNMAFALRMRKMDKAEIDRRVNQAAEILGLTPYLDRYPRALSGGQRQRVAMGRAIVREPKVFLLDEPLSNLDAKLRVQMRTEILRLQRRLGTTMVYVTHDQTEAMTLGHRIAVLRKGQVLQIGTPRELYARPSHLFVAGFIGSPPMNFLPARCEQARLVLPIGSIPLSKAQQARMGAAGGQLIVGFRPEDLRSEPQDAGELQIEARAEVIEWLGADAFVYFNVAFRGFEEIALPDDLELQDGDGDQRSLSARVDPSIGVREGDALRLHLSPTNLHVFDAGSGENLAFHAD